MWNRLFELLPKLLEALPHLDRFSSAADRLLSAKAGEDAARLSAKADIDAALLSSIESLRTDLNRVDATHVAANAVLTHKLDELSAEIVTTAGDAQASRSINVALGHSIVAIERQLRSLRALLVSIVILIGVLILITGWLLLSQPRP